jgi:Kef-type K+ transport system membrane component KefB
MTQLFEMIPAGLARGENLNLILLIGIAIFCGTTGAKVFQRLRIPQIVGYIVVGITIGPLLRIITPQTIKALEPFNVFALGVIGFLIGGELKRDVFVKFGKQVAAILLFEGLTAFVLVGVLSFLVMWCFFSWQTALAVGIVFGAICAATDPASTVNVLWEYKSRGPLTTMLTTVVALDDALALVLYIVSVSVAGVIISRQEVGLSSMAFYWFREIIGSLALGAGGGLALRWILKWVNDNEKTLVFTIGTVVLIVGTAARLRMDAILSSMALGVTLVNISARRSVRSFELVRSFSPPIYVLFFVLIGARLNISGMTGQIWLLAAAYIIGSIIGKTMGSYWGAVYSKTVPTVRKYLGFCLYQQGTIAIALLIMASERFENQVQIRDTMLSVIIIGVFVLQFAGPLFVKLGLKKASEAGLNITEEDLIETYTVKDVMDSKPTSIAQDLPLHQILEVFSTSESVYYPVIDSQSWIIGVITIADIKEMFANQDVGGWLLACDVAEPVLDKTTPTKPLEEVMEQMRRYDLQNMPVVASSESDELVGVLDYSKAMRKISTEVLHRRKMADEMAAAAG